MKWWMWLLIGLGCGLTLTVIAALTLFYRTFKDIW